MKRLAVLANAYKPLAGDLMRQLAEEADALGLDWRCDAATDTLLRTGCVLPVPELFEWADAVLAMGGDGTMLRVVRMLGAVDRPVFGLNIGSLGFMTSSPASDLKAALACLRSERYSVTERSQLRCRFQHGEAEPEEHLALNDSVVRASRSRMMAVETAVNGDEVTTYACDGIIVSTPTGSTGHSLSAGGPIVLPSAAVFVVSVICPHTLSSRPIVVPDECVLDIRLSAASEVDATVSIDGQVNVKLERGDTMSVARAARAVRFLHMPGFSYFGVLRQKLGWRGSHTCAP